MSSVPAETAFVATRASRRRLYIAGLLTALALAAVGYWLFTREAGPDSAYETATVTRTDVRRTVSGTGTVEPSQRLSVRAARPGLITGVGVEVGQEVAPAQELFRINGQPVFALPGEAPFYRTLQSGDEGDDVRSLQSLLANLGYLDGEVDGRYGQQTRSAVRRFREDRGLSTDTPAGPETFQAVGRSPVVAEVGITVGSLASANAPVLTLVPAGELEAVVRVNEVDIAQVKLDQEVVLTLDALPGKEVRARVIELPFGLLDPEGAGGAGVVSFPVRVLLEEPPSEIKPGMTAEADLVLETAENVVAVPVGGLQEEAGRDLVLVPGPNEDDPPQAVPVELGLRSDDFAEVRSGLDEGDVIIVGLDVSQIELPERGLLSAPSPRSTDTPVTTD